MKGTAIKLSNLRIFPPGLLLLFVIAHFGHHVVGAMLTPLMPMIRTELGLSYAEAGVLISVFFITSGVSQLPAGWLADRLGARTMIFVSISGVAAAGLLVGFSNSYIMLTVLLALTALLGGGYHPASAPAISSLVSPDRRGQALGIHMIGGTSSMWIVPLLAAPIAAAWGWRGPYITLTIPVIILGIVIYYLMGRQIPAQARQPQLSAQKMAPPPAQIRWRVLVPFLVLSVGVSMITQSVAAYFSLYAVDYLKVPDATAAALMAVMPAAGVVVATWAGRLSDRFGTVPVLIVVSLLAMPLLYVLTLVTNVPSFVVVLIFIGITNMLRVPATQAHIIVNVPEKRRSTILGVYFLAGAELTGLMAPLVGRLIDVLGFRDVFIIAAVCQVAITVVCSVLLRRNRAE